MYNKVDLYRRLYDIELGNFVSLKEAVLSDDVDRLTLEVLEYLSDFITDDFEESTILFEEVIKSLSNIPEAVSEFEFNGVVYKMTDIDKLTTAELIDLESYYEDNNIIKVCSILFRPIVPENGCIELYEGTSKYEGVVEKIPFNLLMGGYSKYLEYRNSFKDRFQYLFKEPEETEESNEFDFSLDEEAQFSEEFNWYSMLFTASKEGYLAIGGHKSVLDSPAEEFLQFMNFFKRKCELDINRIKAPKQV